MSKRFLGIALVVAVLATLIFYSQFRKEPNRVSGFIEADEIRIGSRVGGRVLAVHVQEGERVKQGQLLIELEPFDLREREHEVLLKLAAAEAEFQRISTGLRPEEIAQTKAKFDQLQARLDLALAGPREQEIEAARNRLKVAEAETKLARLLFNNRAELFQQKVIAREEFDKANEALEAAAAMTLVRKQELELFEAGTREEEKREAQARVEEARQTWELAKQGFRQEEIDKAKATRDAAQAALDAIRVQVKELQIKSPVDGMIEAHELRVGDLVPAGAPVLSIMDTRHLWLRAYIPQNRIGLKTGQKLKVVVDSFPNESYAGEITFISRQAEFTPNNVQTPAERVKQVFRAKIDLREGLDKLRPGMMADVWLDPLGGS